MLKDSKIRRQETADTSCESLSGPFHAALIFALFALFLLAPFPLAKGSLGVGDAYAVWTIQGVDSAKQFTFYTGPSLAIDKTTNVPHIAYGGDHLYHAFFDGSRWIHETADTSTGVGRGAAMAIDGKGKVHIIYFDATNEDLRYATNSLGKWQAITLDTGGVGLCTSIAVDSNNKVHISYFDWNNGDLKYATNASGAWVITTVDSAYVLDSSIAMDSNNKVHITYCTNNSLKYATNVSGTWVITTVDSSDFGFDTAIAVDSNNKVHITYNERINDGLKYATNASGTWVITTVDSSDAWGTFIAVDSNNKVHISYCANKSLKYATNASGPWVIKTVDSSDPAYSSIATDSNNKVHISYFANNSVKYATNVSGTWVTTTIDSAAGNVGLTNSIALDSNDKNHISYYDQFNGDLKYATNASGTWVITTVDSAGDVGLTTSIAVDSDNKIHISYWDYTNGDLKYATNASGPWVITMVDNVDRTGEFSSIAVDSNNKVHISYYHFDSWDLKYATNASGTWVITTVDSTGEADFTSITLDSNNKVHISYFDWNNFDLKYATNASGTWVITTVDSAGLTGEFSSIALDSKNKVHISYYDGTNRDLKYATNVSGTWVIKTVDRADEVGLYTSIAVDSNNKVHISYWDNTNDNLKYATNASGSWIKTTVDSSGGVGLYTSIALDSDDKAHISYYDYTNGRLKYATNAVVDVTPPLGTVTVENDDSYTKTISVNLSTSCGDLQGRCTHMKFSNDGLSWSDEETYSSKRVGWNLTSATDGGKSDDGLKTVYAQFWDSAGNWSEPASDTIILDTTGPDVTADPAGGPAFGAAISVTLTCSDGDGSGCDRIYYTLDGKTPTILSSVYTAAISINKDTTLKFMATDNLGNKSIVKTEIYKFIPGVTELTLDLSSPTIEYDGTVTAWGRLQNLTQNGADPTGETISLEVTDPLGEKTTMTTTITDPLGFYLVEGVTGFTHKGAYTLQAHFAGSGLLAKADSQESVLLVGASAGYAIIVEGKIPIEEGLESHNKTANRIYERLRNRGFTDENIYYFNYQSQGGVDGKPLKAVIQYAVEEWAAPRMNGMPAQLYIIMVDHGSPEAFHIDTETISPENLNAWLKTLEAGLNAEAILEKRVIIIGACYSGSFMPVLSKAPTKTDGGRVVVTSAAEDEVSYKGPKEDDNIRSGEFFLEEFFIQLERGYTIKEAFETATASTEIFTQKGGGSPNNNAPYFDGAVQHPLLDDNGDGVGSNLLTAGLFDDGAEAEALVLGVGPDYQTNGAENPAEVTEVTSTRYLASTQTSALLWAKVNNDDWVDTAVWMEIRPPSMVLNPKGGTGQEEVDIPKVPMVRDNGRWEKDPFLADPPLPFSESGKYEIYYYVKDIETEQVSPMKRSVVYKNKVVNKPPSVFDLLSPANGSKQTTSLILDWNNTTDPDGDLITYTVLISRDSTFATVDYTIEELTASMAAIGSEAGLQDLTKYYWKVMAVDSYGARTSSSQTWSFNTDNTNGTNGLVCGYVRDETTGKPIELAQAMEDTTLLATSQGDGSYCMMTSGGSTLDFVFKASGYRDSEAIEIYVPAEARLIRNIELTPIDTTITSKPVKTTTSKTAMFKFTSSEAGATFRCKLDNSAYTVCASPKTYSGLAKGSHTFMVKSVDATGNMDITPASYTWRIE